MNCTCRGVPVPMGVVLIVIRWAGARTIYRDPMFTAYAIQANPPIHVIVENGKVTLKGVATPMEKQIAETKVRTSVTAFEVTNDLQVEELG
jgi:hyperosmotically inducible periplasmic protein